MGLMGIRSSETCQLNFDDVKVPKENLLGKEGQGFKIAIATPDGGRGGIAQGACESAVEYARERVDALVAALKKDGYDFTVGIPMDTPIPQAERVVSAGQGIGSSRPVAETHKYVPLNRYVGMSGQKFKGNLYIACGISGAIQHLKGIKDASTIVAINKSSSFSNHSIHDELAPPPPGR